MEIHQLISKLQTPSKEEIRYKVGEVLGKSATSEVEQVLRLIYEDEIRKRRRQFVEDDNTRTKIAQMARWICESRQTGLMLYGNVGAGKTMLLNTLIRLFREVGYWHPPSCSQRPPLTCANTSGRMRRKVIIAMRSRVKS